MWAPVVGAAAPGLAPSGPGRTRTRVAQLSRRAPGRCAEEHAVGVRVQWDRVLALPIREQLSRETAPKLSFPFR